MRGEVARKERELVELRKQLALTKASLDAQLEESRANQEKLDRAKAELGQ